MRNDDVPFHLTAMGRRYYEGTLPALVRELERLNENIEKLRGADVVNAARKPVDPDAAPPSR